jgi:hypothetical protein
VRSSSAPDGDWHHGGNGKVSWRIIRVIIIIRQVHGAEYEASERDRSAAAGTSPSSYCAYHHIQDQIAMVAVASSVVGALMPHHKSLEKTAKAVEALLAKRVPKILSLYLFALSGLFPLDHFCER